MIAEIGQFSLALAMLVYLAQSVAPLIGIAKRDLVWTQSARRLAYLNAFLLLVAFLSLVWCYVASDFSVLNVALNSHSAKPLLYKISGVWSNHEGSMLLWTTLLALYGAGFAFFGRSTPDDFQARILSVQAMLSIGFVAFVFFVSNPFVRLDPPAVEGQGMNPMLQDPGLALHPPFLYLGYVGFSICFAFAVAALIEGKVGPFWARTLRPWALISWSFLTLGVMLGSWWAYYTLGWGGWWYWDPVENASLAPWLLGTALLHSLIVVERRDALKSWSVLLAILTFSLSLLGTFLVRSGVLTSVHSFAADPSRGLFILGLLGLVCGASLLLFAIRASSLGAGGLFRPISREGFILFGNVLLSAAAGTVLLGTLYPIFTEALDVGKISVGPPFFNKTVLPLLAPMAAIMAVGPLLFWREARLGDVMKRLSPALAACFLIMAIAWIWGGVSGNRLAAGGGLALGVWLIAGTLAEAWPGIRGVFHARSTGWGMRIAHIGLAVTVIGIAGDSGWSEEQAKTMLPGDHIVLAGFDIRLRDVEENIRGPNYVVTRARLDVTKDGQDIAVLTPEIRHFIAPPRPISGTSIHVRLSGDLYAALASGGPGQGWVIRLYWHFLTPWIFVGGALMAMGGFLAWGLRLKSLRPRQSLKGGEA